MHRESEHRLLVERSALLESAADGIYAIDREGFCTFINGAASRMLGYELDECLGRNMHALVHDRFADGSAYPVNQCPIFQSVSTGFGARVENEVAWHKDGHAIPVEYSAQPIVIDGVVEGAVVTMRDVTLRREAQEALASSERRLRLALMAGRMGTWFWDSRTNRVQWDAALEVIYGLEPGTFGGTYAAFLERVHPDDRARVIAEVTSAGEKGSDYEIEFRTIRPDGEVRWIADRGQVLLGTSGRVGISGVCWDSTERKRAEQELTESRGQVVSILESITDGFAAYDRDWRCTFVNHEGARLLHRSPEELTGKVIWEIFPEAVGSAVYQEAQRAVRDQVSVELEQPSPLFGVWWFIRIFPSKDGATIYYRDVTGRRRMERRRLAQYGVSRALATAPDVAEARRRTLEAAATNLESTFGAFWMVDPTANVLRCTDTWVVPGSTAEPFAQSCRRAEFARGIGSPGRVWVAGEPIWIENLAADETFTRRETAAQAGLHSCFGFPVIAGGSVLGVVELFTSAIAEPEPELLLTATVLGNQIGQFLQRKQAEQDLLQSEARNRAILQTALDCIITIDSSSRILEFNPAAERTFGHTRDQVIGRFLPDLLIPPGFRDAHRAGMTKYFLTGEGPVIGNRIEVPALHADGHEFPIELAINRIPIDGEALFTAYLRDITERKRHEEELNKARNASETASHAKSQFLASMSHELRTPLNAIIGYSEMLQEEVEDLGVGQLRPDLLKIHGAGKHLLELINEVLDLSKIEAGRMELFVEEFDVADAVEEIAGTVQPLVQKNSNHLEVVCAPGVGAMRADLTKFRQSVLNLLSNASKFTEKGAITLRAERLTRDGKDWIRIQVSDTGIGIAADKLEQLFEPFLQADASTSRNYGGTGLGLALSRRFSRLMGGDVSAQSEEGKGSVFTIELPASGAERPEDLTETPHADPAIGAILVVDDDPTARDLIQRSLEREGFHTVAAASGIDALQLARKLRPRAITLDVMMPGMDGWAVLGQLKGDPETCDIPVVIVTILEDRNLAYSLGATDYLTKPINRERLAHIVRKHHCVNPPCRVLVVEDDPDSRGLLCSLLEREEWTVVEADNGAAALEKLEEFIPELILLDLMMPRMDGFDVVAALRRDDRWKEIPVVVITAKDVTEEDRRRLNGQVERIVSKGSLDQEALLAEVRRVVAR